MILIRYINILRGALPRFFINIKCFIADFFLLDKNHSTETSKKILLIRPDGIGDFIQWLPSAYAMADYYKKLNYEITLLANSAWLDYSKSFNIFDGYAELNRKKFTSDTEYKKFLISNLNNRGFEKIIYLSASREFAIGDSLMRLLKSNEKIGFKGDNSNDAWLWLTIGNKWYSKLIDIAKEKKYEPYLNTVLLKNLNIPLPQDNVPAISAQVKEENLISGDYFILIPGSNMNLKQWDFKNFLSIAERIIKQTGLICVFCGGEKESGLLKKNEKLINFNYENYINKTSLQELTALISKSKFVLSNDTGAVHIAAGLNKPAYCIYGGGHFGRFLPYQEDKSVPRILPTVIYNKMECFNCNWKCKYQITKNNPARCIESVTVEQVWNEIEKGINNNFKNLFSN